MTIESDLYAKLAAIGATYPGSLPTSPSLPSVSYKFISEVQMRTHSGNALHRRRLQIDCWGKTYVSACTLSDSVKAALDLDKSTFELITAENAVDLHEPEPGIFHRALEFFLWE
jgi:hypothetical protein